MIGQTISHYRVLQKIGQGGMGEVYLAEDTELHRRVAIKFLPSGYASSSDALERFKREARAAASLDHPNIITIYEVSEHEGRPYIAMAYVEGAPLSSAIAGGPMPIDTVLDYASQIADGLGNAHGASITHRDVKPDNILVTTGGQVKILDFGLAKLGGITRLTNEASTLGTIYYMSPEQARTSDVDHRSDLFSLGTIMYEMITGRLPFEGEHPAAVAYAITTEEPHPLARFNSEATPELQRIVSKLLSKDREERYQSAADLLADLRRVRRLSMTDVSAAPISSPPRRHRGFKLIIPAAVIGAVVALWLIFKPFTFEFSSDQPAVASDNTLAIMYFDNKADSQDEQRIGEIVTDLLITDLSESSAIKVLSSQRLYDLLKLEGKEGVKRIDPGTSTDIARRAGAKWMLMGSILKMEPGFVVTSQIVDVATGAVTTSQHVSGTPGEDVFAVTDRLSNEIRRDMALPVAETAADDSGIKVSTKSAVAYRYYLEGIEHHQRYENTEGRERFGKAIEVDSTFAMAYFQLSRATGPLEAAQHFIELARTHSQNVTEREKLWIDARYAQLHSDHDKAVDLLKQIAERFPEDKEAYYVLGRAVTDDNEAVRFLRKAIEIDPLYKLAYNQLAYAYEHTGDVGQSIWAINKYIELAPDEHNPYDTRGDLYARAGQVDEAIASYRKALELKPDFVHSIRKLGHLYRAKRDYPAAESTYRRLLDSEHRQARSYARNYIAGNFTYQGKFAQAIEQYDQGIAADRLDNNTDGWHYWDKHLLKSQVYALLGDYDRAIAAAEQIPRLLQGSEQGGGEGELCRLYADSGDLERADRIAEALKGLETPERPDDAERAYRYCQACIASAHGRFDDALEHHLWIQQDRPNDFAIWNRLPRARAYQAAGRLSNAVKEYEATFRRFDDTWGDDPSRAVVVHYYLGTAYEESGWTDKAIERYEEFLDIWKDADPGIAIIDDAKRRLEKLRQGS